ncbi:hypothetical protein BDZ91DRAFT_791471 [Kalaharituber pfeilii]|nr:hypothetical protein BDZ91DRAFT_791471 [Kalaharituber pfeilii]
MRASVVIALAAIAAVASAGYNGTHTNGTELTITETVTAYTTYCPYPTTIVENNHTYTVTEPTTLTITDCPCTRTRTYTTVTETHCPGGCHKPTDSPTFPNTTYVAPPSESTVAPSPNITGRPVPPPSEGGAVSNQATLVGGALAALVGVAAYLL